MTSNDPRQAGDLSAAQLFREHGAFVARFLYRLGVPPQAIEDAVQDVFLVVHQRGGYRPGPAKPTTYLALIASRAASAQRRQQRLRVAREGSTAPEEIHAQDDDPALRAERRADLARLQHALAGLDPALRDTLLLSEFEDETAPAIARAMGVSVGTVYWRLHEARKRFQRALAIADGSGAQAAARVRSRRRASVALSRRAKLAVAFGLLSSTEARALFQATRDVSVEFDVDRALQRHRELTGALPAPPPTLGSPPSTFAWGARSGVVEAGAWAGAATLCAFLSLQLLHRAPGASPRADAALGTHAAVALEDSPASTAPESVQTSLPVGAAQAELGASSRSQRARARGFMHERLRPDQQRDPSSPAARGTTGGALEGASRTRGAHDALREPASAASQEAAADARQPAHREDPPATPSAAALDPHQPEPAAMPSSAGADPLREARELARADRLLATRPAQALAIVERLPRASDHAYLLEERQYIEVMALYGLGRQDEANRAADHFLARFGSSVYRERVSATRKAAAPR